MYDTIVCGGCGRNISNEAEAINMEKKKIIPQLEKYSNYLIYGETLDVPMKEIIKKYHLTPCCVTVIMDRENICEKVYGFNSVERPVI